MSGSEPQQNNAEEGLGFDLLALIKGFRLHGRLIVLMVILSAIAGISSAYLFGKKIYRSETILRYRKVGPGPVMGETNFILTQLNMIKLSANLEKVRERLQLNATISSLGHAITASPQRNTSLITIQGTWDDPVMVASLTNCIRDVFLENGLRTRQQEAGKKLEDLQKRLDTVKAQLISSQEKLKEFTTKNQVIDLDKEAQWYLEQMINLDMLYEQARIEEKTVSLQLENLGKLIDNLKLRVAEESKSNKTMENIGALNIKIGRLKEAINEDKSHRAAMVELTQKKAEYERAQELFKKRLISAADLERAKADFDKQQALAIDTEQTRTWKKEADELKKIVLPDQGKEGPSGEVLRSMMLKSFELDLTAVAIKDKVMHLEQTRNRVKEKLDQLPALQSQHAILSRDIAAGEQEKKTLEAELADIRSQFESNEFDFTVISDAKVPIYPYRSNRKTIAAGVGAGLLALCLAGLLLFELVNTSVRSEKDLELKLGLKVLGVIPAWEGDRKELFPFSGNSAFIEEFRIIAKQIRSNLAGKGARLLVVSADDNEGKTMVASNLANCFGRTDEKVLLIDAQVREVDTAISLIDFISAGQRSAELSGLGEYLSFKAEGVEEIIAPTLLPRVSCIPRAGHAVIPDLLNSNRMKELLEKLSTEYSMIIIDSPAVLKYVDADILATMADAVLMVVRSGRCSKGNLVKAARRLEQAKTQIIGAILTDVNKIYL